MQELPGSRAESRCRAASRPTRRATRRSAGWATARTSWCRQAIDAGRSSRSRARSRSSASCASAGFKTAVVSSSRNCDAGAARREDRRPVRGAGRRRDADRGRGTAAASPRRTRSSRPPSVLGVRPARTVVVEDAISGVAGRPGRQLRAGHRRRPRAATPTPCASTGRDIVVSDLAELLCLRIMIASAAPRSRTRDSAIATCEPLRQSDASDDQARPRPPARVHLPDRRLALGRAARSTPEFIAQSETTFSTANGYLGMRGGFQEGRPSFLHGTFVNGFYETWPIPYGEKAFGFAKTGQTMVNVPGRQDHPPVRRRRAVHDRTAPRCCDYERALDMQARHLRARDAVGDARRASRCRSRSTRLVSFTERHVAAIRYEVTVLNATRAGRDRRPRWSNHAADHDRRRPSTSARGVAPPTEDDPRLAKAFKDQVLVPEQVDARRTCACSSATARAAAG